MIFAYQLHKDLKKLQTIGVKFQKKKEITDIELEKLVDAFDSRIIEQFKMNNQDNQDNQKPFNTLFEYFIDSHYLILSAIGYILKDKNYWKTIAENDNYKSVTTLAHIRKNWVKNILKGIDFIWKVGKGRANQYKSFKLYAKKEQAWQDLQDYINKMYSEEYDKFTIAIQQKGNDYTETI